MNESAQSNTKNRLASTHLPTLEWLLLSALFAIFLLYGFIPAWRTMNTDFPNYFLPAAIHHQGLSIDRAYEWRWFQRHKDHFEIDQPLVGFVPNPPICAAPLMPLASLPSLQAKRVWLIFNLILLTCALWLLSRSTALPGRRLVLLALLCVLPLRDNFLFGQYYAVILFLITLAYYAHSRGHQFSTGAILSVAAWLKIFPVFFLVLFLRRKNWRALAGLAVGGVALGALSVLLFGWNLHQILFTEILPRALHGDLVGPYAPQWNSFTSLCHRLFLYEPELNPTPWLNSSLAYAVVQALVATGFLFSFLFFTTDQETPATTAWEWSTFVAVLMLMSSMPSPYHYCVLIFTMIVAIDYLLSRGSWKVALAAAILFAIACYPLPGFALVNLQLRLVAVFFLYMLLLWNAPAPAGARTRKFMLVVAAIIFAGLSISNLHVLKNRTADFSRRISMPAVGYGSFAVVKAGGHLLVNEMLAESYGSVSLPEGRVQPVPAHSDVLAIAASPQSPYVYFELTNQTSRIFRLPAAQIGQSDALPEYVGDGKDPVISPDGRWLAFMRDEGGKDAIWLSKDGSTAAPVQLTGDLRSILEMSLTSGGSIIAAAGSPANPHLISLNPNSGVMHPLDVSGPVRYPAISPDGKRLAFSRRESGSWHLFVRELAGGREQQLTTAACNATSPSWEDANTLLYITDCGRGYGLGAPARIVLEY